MKKRSKKYFNNYTGKYEQPLIFCIRRYWTNVVWRQPLTGMSRDLHYAVA